MHGGRAVTVRGVFNDDLLFNDDHLFNDYWVEVGPSPLAGGRVGVGSGWAMTMWAVAVYGGWAVTMRAVAVCGGWAVAVCDDWGVAVPLAKK